MRLVCVRNINKQLKTMLWLCEYRYMRRYASFSQSDFQPATNQLLLRRNFPVAIFAKRWLDGRGDGGGGCCWVRRENVYSAKMECCINVYYPLPLYFLPFVLFLHSNCSFGNCQLLLSCSLNKNIFLWTEEWNVKRSKNIHWAGSHFFVFYAYVIFKYYAFSKKFFIYYCMLYKYPCIGIPAKSSSLTWHLTRMELLWWCS